MLVASAAGHDRLRHLELPRRRGPVGAGRPAVRRVPPGAPGEPLSCRAQGVADAPPPPGGRGPVGGGWSDGPPVAPGPDAPHSTATGRLRPPPATGTRRNGSHRMATPPRPPRPHPTARAPDRADAPVVVIGGGPAGLTAAYRLAQAGDPVVVVEQDTVLGGISRTVERDGWRFDIGGHRFFTKVRAGRGVLARDPARRGLPAAPPDEPHLLRRQVLRLPDQARQRPVQPRASSRRSGAGCPSCGCGSARRRTRPPSRATSSPTTAGGSTTTSSRPTTRRCGACPPPSSRPTGAPSGSRACRCGTRCGSRSGRRSGSRRDKSQAGHQPHRGVPVPEVRPGMMWERCAEQVVGPRRRGPHGDVGHHGPRGGRAGRGRDRRPRRRHRAGRGRPRDLLDAVHRPGPGDRPAGARRGAARPPTTSTTGTS